MRPVFAAAAFDDDNAAAADDDEADCSVATCTAYE